MSDVAYCDNYDEIMANSPKITSTVKAQPEAKVVAPVEEKPAPKHSAKAETKDGK